MKLVVLRSAKEVSLSVTPVEQRSELDTVSNLADPEKNLCPSSDSRL